MSFVHFFLSLNRCCILYGIISRILRTTNWINSVISGPKEEVELLVFQGFFQRADSYDAVGTIDGTCTNAI